MKIPLYQVDAFTDRVFAGNPAGVCPLEDWIPAATMQAIAAENNLPETAFFVPAGDGFADEQAVRALAPDMAALAKLDFLGVIAGRCATYMRGEIEL